MSILARGFAIDKEEVTKEILEQVLEFSERAVKLNGSFVDIDSYAHLLYKLDRVEEAKEQALKAVEVFNNEDFPEFVRKDFCKTLWSIEFLNEEE